VRKKNKKVVIGGTFDILHKGHKALLKKAFKLGKVFIGLTSDKMAREMRDREIKNFKDRKKELENFVRKEFKVEPKIFKIENKFGFTLKRDFDYIVVSPETYQNAIEINKERLKRKKKLIEIIEIDFVLAEDGKPISAERIARGEIDREGKLLK
jgi:pantetheine-phosphate adenylyltransferase